MGKNTKSHRIFKDRAMNRVDDLQVMLMDLQSARKESRKIDMALLEEQVHQMLKEWKKELNEPSPASSLQQGASLVSFSPDISRLLQLYDEEEDDATSGLAAPKPDPDAQNATQDTAFHKNFVSTQVTQEQCKDLDSPFGMNNNTATQLDHFSFDLAHDFYGMWSEDGSHPITTTTTGFLPNIICPPPSAFLGPKCALWDCPRPAQNWCFERAAAQWWCTTYCSHLHAAIAQNEGQPGMNPIIRPKGIELKDNLLFSALCAKAQGKNVGVPECEGAATAKSPWNAPELFDLSVFEGETLREWLFFDKPRRAFESGNRKQRSLPDYNGRGWHESRKQVINESGWLKRSYYMDPQPMKFLEWHLYEYEISKYDACALYRLELKLVDRKRNPKGKIGDHSVVDLQKQMGRLSAEFRLENNKRSVKGRGRASSMVYPTSSQIIPTTDVVDYGANAGFNFLMEDLGGYYLT